MEIMFLNGVSFSVEFIKLMLVTIYILKIRVKNSINAMFGLSFLGIVITSYWFDVSEYSILYGLIAFVIFWIALYEKRNIGFVILSYIGISIIDMLFGNVCINLFDLTMEQVQEEFMLLEAMNSISLVFIIIIICVISRRIKRDNTMFHVNTYLPIIILGGLSLSVYLTYTQFVGLENQYISYQNGLLISAVAITIVYSLICYFLLDNQNKNLYLKLENDMNQRLLKAQSDYYSMLFKKETETKMFRHDVKNHIMCIQMLYEQKKYDELGDYLNQMENYTKELSPKVVTGNMYIDLILADLSEQFPDVIVEWIGKVPEVSISSMDICTLFYNLLKNAFESAHNVSDKLVKVIIKIQGTNLIIIVLNYYQNLNRDNNYGYITTKKEKGHGYGLKNIQKCVEKYHGSYMITTENEVFQTEIILSDIILEM